MSYGPSFPEVYRRAGDYVDKILRGTKPADIPVEQPTKFDSSNQPDHRAGGNSELDLAAYARTNKFQAQPEFLSLFSAAIAPITN